MQGNDKGSHHQSAQGQIQGVPVYGIVDSGTDSTIIIVVVYFVNLVLLKFKKPDNTPCIYVHPSTSPSHLMAARTFLRACVGTSGTSQQEATVAGALLNS